MSAPEFAPPVIDNYIPAELFDVLQVTRTWDLKAFRGGKLCIGWGMNQKLWLDSDEVDIKLGQQQKIVFKNSSGRLHPMHIHGVFFRILE